MQLGAGPAIIDLFQNWWIDAKSSQSESKVFLDVMLKLHQTIPHIASKTFLSFLFMNEAKKQQEDVKEKSEMEERERDIERKCERER